MYNAIEGATKRCGGSRCSKTRTEGDAYREAIARNINAIGTVRILERAAEERLLDLKDAFQLVKQTDFWISHKLLDERLKL